MSAEELSDLGRDLFVYNRILRKPNRWQVSSLAQLVCACDSCICFDRVLAFALQDNGQQLKSKMFKIALT